MVSAQLPKTSDSQNKQQKIRKLKQQSYKGKEGKFLHFEWLYLLNSPPGVAVNHIIGAEELGQKLSSTRVLLKLFPCVCSLRDRRARGDHVQQVLPLTSVDGGWRLVTCQAGVHVRHSDSCEHATEQQVKVWSKMHAGSLMPFWLNEKKAVWLDTAPVDTRPHNTHRLKGKMTASTLRPCSHLALTCLSSDHSWSDLPAIYANKHVHHFHLQSPNVLLFLTSGRQ